MATVSRERLTRNEIAWLLAQEARGAAKALRDEVNLEKAAVHAEEARDTPVESTLDALDDAIDMLSALNTRTANKSRRGRIDLAALLCEVAPKARIAIEPGAGTEIYGEESDLRRMLSVLCAQAAPGDSSGTEVRIRRAGTSIKISVELGPDGSVTGELERRWLNRMALRQGGRFDLEGGTQSIVFQAEPWESEQRDLNELRRELEQTERSRGAYARELSGRLEMGELPSEPPPPRQREALRERLTAARKSCRAIEQQLRTLAVALESDVEAAREHSNSEGLATSLSLKGSALKSLAAELALIDENLPEE